VTISLMASLSLRVILVRKVERITMRELNAMTYIDMSVLCC
jgi:hypothetical protein